jgi:ribonucleotide reductase alpha subunit
MHAKARAPFICQTMSLNYYFNVPTMKDVATLLCLADELGLKTISYYMHSAPASGSQKTSIQNTADDSDSESSDEKEPEASHSAMVIAACRRDDPSCVSCSV